MILKMIMPSGKINHKYYVTRKMEGYMSNTPTWIVTPSSGMNTGDVYGGIVTYKGPPPKLVSK